MPVYRSEVTWDGVSTTAGNPSIFFSAADDNETWAIEVRRDLAGVAAFVFYFNATPDPGLGSLISGTSSISDASFAAYDNGGTIAIEKDEALDEVRFITPLGTQTRTLTGFGANDATILRPVALALQHARNPTNVDSQATVKWFDFYGKSDGNNFIGASMAETDPGLLGRLQPGFYGGQWRAHPSGQRPGEQPLPLPAGV